MLKFSDSRRKVASSFELAAESLNDDTSELNAALNSLVNFLVLSPGGQPATDESITSTVGVDDVLLGDSGDLDVLNLNLSLGVLGVVSGNNDWLGLLGDHNNTGTVLVSLLILGDVLGGTESILGVKTGLLGIARSLILIHKDEVGVLKAEHDIVISDVQQEDSGQVEGEGLVLGGSQLADLSEGLVVGSDEETGGVDDAGIFESSLIFVEVGGGVLGGGADVSAQSSLFTLDDDSATTSGDLISEGPFADHLDIRQSLLQSLTGGIFGDAAEEADLVLFASLSEDVIAGTSRVKSSSTTSELSIVTSEKLIMDGHSLLINEGGLTVFESVLGVDFVVGVLNSDVQKGVLNDHDRVILSSFHQST